jgi:2'-hydroxyisoflavone reductase
MRLLILGGTIFLGRHLAELAMAEGDTVTLFTRGKHNPDILPPAERIKGDRATDLHLVEGRRWDAVVDTSGYLPEVVRASAKLLAGSVGHYTFISSISVYRDFRTLGIDEGYPCGEMPEAAAQTVTDETYGPLKALCERAVAEELPGRALHIRPGLIVGPHDPSDRFTYWPERVARGGEVLAPDSPHRVAQVIDARDLAAWILSSLREGLTGVFNATSPGEIPGTTGPRPESLTARGIHQISAARAPATAPAGAPATPSLIVPGSAPARTPCPDFPLTFGGLLDACREVSGSDARFNWLPEPFLAESKVGPWMELPLWVPRESEMLGFDAVSVERAVAAGLRFRPITETIRDTLSWAATLPPDRMRRAGLDPAKEAEILRRWNERGDHAETTAPSS